MQWRGVRHLSVCLRKWLLLPDKWSDRHQTCIRWSPGEHASSVCSRSRSGLNVTWYQHIWNFTKKSLTQSFPNFSFPLSIRFSSAPNFKMAVSLRCEWRHSSHGETVCQTDSYTVRSDVLSLHVRALTLWSTIALSFQYQAARCNV